MTAIRYVRGTMPGLPGERDIAILDGDTHISRWVEEARRLDHDQSTLPAIGMLITPESVVWDIGALIGDHTAFYASLARAVVAWEPCADSYECLRQNMAHYSNVFCLQYAVGDGTRALIHENPNAGARSLRENATGFITVSLDDFVVDPLSGIGLGKPTLIKLDIEGWEVRALRGAERTLREYHPIIVCEVNCEALERAGTSPEELHALLTAHGYEMHDLFTGEGWFSDDPTRQFDVVARWRG